ncbi:MAG: hypothetical protein Ct9H300mP1_03760 [Planctomycetaceae bacterium]|nr:MAG: hypothetical protein Ct9H300mP1_03760 [Planctomycetaceae bacterium]
MQSRNGGWGAFDRDNTRELLTRVPFADHNAMIDPPTADLTARVLEMLGGLGVGETHPAVIRATDFLWDEQEPDGSWYGRWGVNYIYGTWQTLLGLTAIGIPLGDSKIRRAADRLKQFQQPCGGWGETPRSYDDPTLRGTGPVTASQTAWAVLGLIAAGEADSPRYPAGSATCWITSCLTAVGPRNGSPETRVFPPVFYLRYHLYPISFPLMALGRYARCQHGGPHRSPGCLTTPAAETGGPRPRPGKQERSMPQAPRSKNQTLLVSDPVFQTHDTGQGHPESIRGTWRSPAPWQPRSSQRDSGGMKPPASDDERSVEPTSPNTSRWHNERSTPAWPCSAPVTRSSAAHPGSGSTGLWSGLPGDRRGRGRTIGQRLLHRPPARSPRHPRSRHGLLHFQQRRRRRPARPVPPQDRPRADRRLGRPPRKRHPGHLLRRRNRVLLQHPPVPLWDPGTGARQETGTGKGLGSTLNRPFPAGTDRKKILPAYAEELRTVADKFPP